MQIACGSGGLTAPTLEKNNTLLYCFLRRLHVTRKYSALSLIREGLNGQRGWEPAWRDAKPKERYDAIVIGGGGRGVATAVYMAKHELGRAWRRDRVCTLV